jgi:ABC-type bacteriocin/lantibiotic exporter with double-glycine peptidase domain
VTFLRERGSLDCGVCALGLLAEISYEDAYVAVARIDPTHRGKSGLHNSELVRAAALLGLTLTPTRAFDLDDDDGILRVRWRGAKEKTHRGGHFVAVRNGFILCPSDGMPMRWREYLEQNTGRACTLLQVSA